MITRRGQRVGWLSSGRNAENVEATKGFRLPANSHSLSPFGAHPAGAGYRPLECGGKGIPLGFGRTAVIGWSHLTTEVGTDPTPLWIGTGRKPKRRRRVAWGIAHRRSPTNTAAVRHTAWVRFRRQRSAGALQRIGDRVPDRPDKGLFQQELSFGSPDSGPLCFSP